MNKQIYEEIYAEDDIEKDKDFQQEKIMKNLNKFWELGEFLKTKYLLNIELVLERISIDKLSELVKNILNVQENLLNNNAKITNLVLQQLDNIFNFIAHCQKDQKELEIIQYQFQIQLTEFFSKVIESKNKLIRKQSRNTLTHLKQYFNIQVCNRQLLTLFLTSIHDNIQIENKIWGTQMLAQFYTKFDINTVQGFISQELIALTEDPKVSVRIEAFKTLFEILRIDEKSSLKRQMLFLVKKMIIDENKDIQNSFCENLPVIVHVMNYQQFEKIIITKYLELLNGVSHNLHFLCLKNLGAILTELISKPNSDDLKQMLSSQKFNDLFKIYFQIPDFVKNYSKYEQKVIFKENFHNFQNIIQLRKVDIWTSIKFLLFKIEGLSFELICYCKYLLSSQFVALINVLDEQNSYQLLNILDDQYLSKNAKCNLKIQIQLLSTFVQILQQVKQQKRDQYIDLYISLLKNDQTQWRFRYVLSQQIDQFIEIFSSDILITKVVFLIFRLCQDQAAIVRKTAAKSVYKILNKTTQQRFKEVVFIHIQGFGISINYQCRQVFLVIMENIILNIDLSQIPKDLLNLFDSFFNDKVFLNIIMFLKTLERIQNKYNLQQQVTNFYKKIDSYELDQQIEICESIKILINDKNVNVEEKLRKLRNSKKDYVLFHYNQSVEHILKLIKQKFIQILYFFYNFFIKKWFILII